MVGGAGVGCTKITKFPQKSGVRRGSQSVEIVWAALQNPGFNPLSLLALMRRFAKIDPLKLHEIQARNLDPQALKARVD